MGRGDGYHELKRRSASALTIRACGAGSEKTVIVPALKGREIRNDTVSRLSPFDALRAGLPGLRRLL